MSKSNHFTQKSINRLIFPAQVVIICQLLSYYLQLDGVLCEDGLAERSGRSVDDGHRPLLDRVDQLGQRLLLLGHRVSFGHQHSGFQVVLALFRVGDDFFGVRLDVLSAGRRVGELLFAIGADVGLLGAVAQHVPVQTTLKIASKQDLKLRKTC